MRAGPGPLYLSANFVFYEASGKRGHSVQLGPCDQPPVDEMLELIEKRGFKLTNFNSMREVLSSTYERPRKVKVADNWVKCEVVLEATAVSGYDYDRFEIKCFDADGNIVHNDRQLKVKKAPAQKFIDALTDANFKITNVDTFLYTKTYTYEREQSEES